MILPFSRCNVGHASTCNSVGQTAGYFLGYVAFMALESKDFCNSYLRSIPSDEGLVTLPGFLYFWGLTFLVSTTLVALLKREHNEKRNRINSNGSVSSEHVENPELNIAQSYKLLLNIIKMKPIQILTVILLTVKISFAACDAVSSLKLIDAGVPKDKLALLVVPLVPLQIVLPLVISKYTTGPRPMDVYVRAIPYRLLLTLLATGVVWLTPSIIGTDKINVPTYYYLILLVNYALYQV